MTPTQLYSILSKKPHNKHYLQRYVTFITACKHNSQYTELHHICPRAKDLFPEYACLKSFPWNGVRLSPRQHFIAHRMLWKAYGGSQTFAFRAMCNLQQSSKQLRCDPVKTSRYYQQNKEDAAKLLTKLRKGKTIFKDASGKTCVALVNDDKVITKELVGVAKGNKFELDQNKGVAVYRNVHTGEVTRLNINDERVTSGEYVHVRTGVLPTIYKDTYKKRSATRRANNHPKRHVSDNERAAMSAARKGKLWYNNGEIHYRLLETDPQIHELGLVKGRLMKGTLLHTK